MSVQLAPRPKNEERRVATRLSSFLGLGASCTDIFLPPSKIEH